MATLAESIAQPDGKRRRRFRERQSKGSHLDPAGASPVQEASFSENKRAAADGGCPLSQISDIHEAYPEIPAGRLSTASSACSVRHMS
jgi:hypothetical protein